MTENQEKKNTDPKIASQDGQEKVKVETKEVTADTSKTETSSTPATSPAKTFDKKEYTKGGFKKNYRARKPRGRFEKPKPEFDQKIIDIRRVTRVVKGGRRFSFSVSMVIGNKKGSVGVGVGKASDTALAIEKAIRNAKKNMIKLKLTKDMSIPYEVEIKYNASNVVIRPAKGRGVVAGSSVRTVLELAGISEVGAKILSRSKNKLNNAKAAIKALSEFSEK